MPPLYSEKLAPLETFDPRAFVASEGAPKHVCDFVLSLAVAFNDLRDLMTAQRYIREARPTSDAVSPALGEFYGLHAHWVRLMTGFVNELAQLIKDNAAALNDPSFQKVVKLLGKPFRDAWASTVNAALATDPKGDRFGRMIYFARNKVAFHYDPKEISRGYKIMFFERGAGPPYISRGDAMEGSRFYFADAAAEQYLMHAAGTGDAKQFFDTGWSIIIDIGHALREIVMSFVNARGYGWREIAG